MIAQKHLPWKVFPFSENTKADTTGLHLKVATDLAM